MDHLVHEHGIRALIETGLGNAGCEPGGAVRRPIAQTSRLTLWIRTWRITTSVAHADRVMDVPQSWNLLAAGVGLVGRRVLAGRPDAMSARPEQRRCAIPEAARQAAIYRACANP